MLLELLGNTQDRKALFSASNIIYVITIYIFLFLHYFNNYVSKQFKVIVPITHQNNLKFNYQAHIYVY